jgi:integrase
VVLHCVFRQAVREGILGRNPLDAVDRPRVETAEFQILNEEQVRQFMIFASESQYETLFHLALTSGMRKGELLGLKWSDVDWVKGVLNVQRQLQNVPDQGYALVAPKSKAGYRQIKLGQGTMRQLEAHQKRQALERSAAGERWQEHGLIFTTSIGTYCDQTKVSRELKRLLKQAGLPDIRFHDLRHTSISFQLEMGTSLNTVQRRAGHSKASVTSDIYGHTSEHSQDATAERIEEMVTPIAVKLQSK